MTEETLAAAWLLRKHLPAMKVRVVNVVDLMRLFPPDLHPHGMSEDDFLELFTATKTWSSRFMATPARYMRCCMATNADRFHVRGYMEEGTTTTPFDMVVLNKASRFHLCIEGLASRRAAPSGARSRTHQDDRRRARRASKST